MKKEKAISFQLEFDLESQKLVGCQKSSRAENVLPDEINLRIIESIKASFEKLGGSWIDDFVEQVERGSSSQAFEIFNKNRSLLMLSKNADILTKLLKLDVSLLQKNERKEFLLTTISYASYLAMFTEIEHLIDQFVDEFRDQVEPDIYHNLLLSKANASAQNRRFNLANSIYKKIVSYNNSTAGTKAWAYRGLSRISVDEKDVIRFSELACDRFLESGQKTEAVKNLVYLSRLLENKDQSLSAKHLDDAIALYDNQKIIDKEFIASLYHKKASYCYSINNIKEGLKFAEKACSFRENLFGNENEKYSSYRLAENLSELLNNKDKTKLYREKADELIHLIKNEEFLLQRKLEVVFKEKQKISTEFIKEIENSKYERLKFSMYLYLAINEELSFEEKLEVLDNAKLLLEEKNFASSEKSLIHFIFGELYRNENMLDDAIENYRECLRCNAFYSPALQNCGAMLWQNKEWGKAVSFFKEQLDKLGELPNLCFIYARSLFEDGNTEEAFKFFIKSKNKANNDEIKKYISLCIDKSEDLTLNLSPSVSTLNEIEDISLSEFSDALHEFSTSVSSDSRMHFWKFDAESKKYKWKSCPEETGKQLLLTYLNGKFGKNCIEIIQENRAGAGIIDLYIILAGGIKIVLELKICGGSGYSSNYALSGESQIVHYLQNKNTNIGFLVVFDGRIRDFGKHFKNIQSVKEFTICTKAIDMRPYLEK